MGVRVHNSQHGFLALQIRRRGWKKWIGTKLRDEGRNRQILEAHAVLIEEDLRAGKRLREALKARLLFEPDGPLPDDDLLPPAIQRPETVSDYYEVWILRKSPETDRMSAISKHRSYFENVILPAFRDVPLNQVTTPVLLDFRSQLLKRTVKGRTIKLKTVRNIIDFHFRSLYRDAREIDRLVLEDPFAAIPWPRSIKPKPDPFDESERDRILDFYRRKRPFWFPFVYFQFWTGCRPSETAALRLSDVDLRLGTVSITKSRSEQHEAAPKTEKSARVIKLLPNVLEVLRAIPQPLHADENTYFFRNPEGRPITTHWWPKKSWNPAVRALGIRPRKFYATRHTFISVAVSKGCNLKWVAEYCGTSVEMIEKSYGKYIADDGASPLLRSLERVKRQTRRQTFAESTGTDGKLPVIPGGGEVVPRGIEPRFAT
jgi:integrase